MNWTELPAKLKIYISFLTIVACPITVWAVWQADWSVSSSQDNYFWLVLTLLTLLTVVGFQYFRSDNTIVGIGDAFIMAIAMLHGVAPCIIATFLHTIIICIVIRNPRIPIYKIIFNTSSAICGAWVYSNVFQFFHQVPT